MRRYTLAPQFLRDFQALEPGMSPADVQALDSLLAAVIDNPQSIQRIQTFYDPYHPSWLVRSDPFVVHYAYDVTTDEVVFLNLFRRH